jgi:hypothetical protein
MQTYFFLASYAFRSKVLVLVIVKKNPRSGNQKKFIPEPGDKKAPDPGSGTLNHTQNFANIIFFNFLSF